VAQFHSFSRPQAPAAPQLRQSQVARRPRSMA